MKPEDLKNLIAESIKNFSQNELTINALNLFNTLGYNTTRQSPLDQPSYQSFKNYFVTDETNFNETKAITCDWNYVDLLFQLTKDEVLKQTSLFDSKQVITKGETQSVIETYLFFVIELIGDSYTRGKLAEITREVNKLFPMPVMILFKYNNFLTLSVINRRLHKKDPFKDVLEKVTLIKDIRIPSAKEEENNHNITHRAHIEILFDLSFEKLYDQYQFKNFVDLHNAWQKTLDTKELNKKFFSELANWYFWAMDNVYFPADLKLSDNKKKDQELRIATNLIRLITRVIFIWFIREKNLVPVVLFRKEYLNNIVKDFFKNQNAHNYYQAILQNLFFGTLNQKMNERGFASEGNFENNINEYGVKNLFRYADKFALKEKEVVELFKDIPFLNGGLFDCLDKPNEENKIVYVDGFSRNPKKQAVVPDFLFFTEKEEDVDLTNYYDPNAKKSIIKKVKGLFEIFNNYKFTVEENTPIEEEIALDPELLGKVFENLLAYYNPETQTTARKLTGSFYTPREIVNYMVDESLIAYLLNVIPNSDLYGEESKNINEQRLRHLLSYKEEHHQFNDKEAELLIEAIEKLKMLDPACGTGAFPMGMLHKLVHILHKLDKDNKQWKELQYKKAIAETEETFTIGNKEERKKRLLEINEVFDQNMNDPNYARKLYLIENCIYGVDIQPIAVQIAKLRFFISLIIDQKKNTEKDNFGIRSLPNLETKFVAANTLIGLEIPTNNLFTENNPIKNLENQLKDVRHSYFSATTRKDKLRLQKVDKEIRKKISEQIKATLINKSESEILRLSDRIEIERKNLKKIEELPDEIETTETADIFGEVTKTVRDKKGEKIKNQKGLIALLENQLKTLNLADTKDAIIKVAQQISSFDPYDQNASAPFFDPEWMFGLTKGFDLIIGNPPYGIVFDKEIKLIFENIYPTFKRNNDIYVAFIECSLALLCDKGILDFITPNTYLNGDYFKLLREYLKEKSIILQIVDFKNSKIFQDPTVFVSISIIRRSTSIYLPYYYAIKISNEVFSKTDDTLNKVQEINDAPFKPLNSLIEAITTVKNKYFVIDERFYVKDVGFNYWTIGKGKKRDGNSIGDRIFYSGERKNKKDKPFLKGKDVDKYLFRDPSNYLRHNYEDYLEEGVDLFRYSKDFLEISPKIIYRQTSNKIVAAIDYAKNLCDKTVHIIVPKYPSESLLFLTALLNSKLFDYIYKDISQEIEGRTFAQVKTTYIKKLPIIKTDDEIKVIVETIVSFILFLKLRLDNKYLLFEYLIDAMVYELYFPEEIKAAGCEVLKHLTDLPAINVETQHAASLQTIEKVHKELSSSSHPVSIAMQKMQEVEEVRIIEGKQ